MSTAVIAPKRYNPAAPRAVLALLAAATAMLTIGAMVVLPAKLELVDLQNLAVTPTTAPRGCDASWR